MMQAWRIPAIAVSAAVIGCLSGPVAAQQPLDTARQTVIQTTNEGRQSQDRIDEISADTQEVVANYRSVLRRIEDLKVYNQRMRDLIAQQEADMASIRSQTERVKTVEREIVPLMIRMTDALEMFIKLDVPFQIKDRLDRIQRLRDTQKRADVALSEKFRLVLEAYQIENDYGRKIAYYEGTLGEGDDRKVEFLTVGRAAFYYQTRDQGETAIWNNRDKKWEPLSSSQGAQVRTAMDMAQEIIPPDLMILPIYGASEGQQLVDVRELTPEADTTTEGEDAGGDADSGDAGGDDGSSPDDSNSN